VLHSFDGADGANPHAGVIQGSHGNFYGTTELGGVNGGGTVFRLTRSGTRTTLYSFCSQPDCADGDYPFGGVIQGSDGNFYGTTYEGGANPAGVANGPGTVFKLTPSGTLTTLYSFCSVLEPATVYCLDGNGPDAGVIQGSDGNFYGTTVNGGAEGEGNVFKLTPSGKLTTLYSFCSQAGCTDGDNPWAGVIQGGDGNFYGATFYGGAFNSGTVFQLTPSGTLTTLHSFCSVSDPDTGHCLDGRNPYAAPIQGSDGNFYGTTGWGGVNDDGNVFKLTPSGELTSLYSFCSAVDPRTYNCLDGQGPLAGVIEGIDGNFYGTTSSGGANPKGVVSDGPGTVFKLTPSGRLTTLHTFCSVFDRRTRACRDGTVPESAPIQSSDGNLYATTLYGGSKDDGTVFKLARGRSDTSR